VALDGQQRELAVGTSIDIPVGAEHRIENATADGVALLEVQRADDFGGNDIVRIHDDDGRVDSL